MNATTGIEFVKLPPIETRPKCRLCGKPLAPAIYSKFGDVAEDVILEIAEQRKCRPDDVRVIRTKATGVGHGNGWGVQVDYWTGRYGYASTDLFCTQGCGYRYGVLAARHKITP